MVAGGDEADKQEQQSLNFGKRLAHTDKKVRDRGFRNVRAFLQGHTELERLDYLKLWRGLYFGMWMSDKRPVQQDLAANMALLINVVPREKQSLWLDTFWQTMQVSWEKLDTHRLSKYLLLIRIVVAEAFKVIRLGGWQASEVKALSETFMRGLPRTAKQGSNAPSLGLNLQFNRILWDELRPQLKQSPEASVEVMQDLLEPFCAVAEGCCIAALVKNIHQHVFMRVPYRYAGKLIFRLLEGAAKKEISKANRQALYDTVDKLERRPKVEPAEPDEEPKPRSQGLPMKKKKKWSKKKRKGQGAEAAADAEGGADAASEKAEGAGAAAEADAAPEAEESRPKKKRRGAGAAGDASPSVTELVQEQMSPLRLPKAAITSRRRKAAAGTLELPPATVDASEQEAAPAAPSKGKRRRKGAGTPGSSPQATAAAAPGDAAPKGPPR